MHAPPRPNLTDLLPKSWACNFIPFLTYFSDNLEHRLGRRRPLIISAAILLIFSYTTLANAYTLGNMLGDSKAGLKRGNSSRRVEWRLFHSPY